MLTCGEIRPKGAGWCAISALGSRQFRLGWKRYPRSKITVRRRVQSRTGLLTSASRADRRRMLWTDLTYCGP